MLFGMNRKTYKKSEFKRFKLLQFKKCPTHSWVTVKMAGTNMSKYIKAIKYARKSQSNQYTSEEKIVVIPFQNFTCWWKHFDDKQNLWLKSLLKRNYCLYSQVSDEMHVYSLAQWFCQLCVWFCHFWYLCYGDLLGYSICGYGKGHDWLQIFIAETSEKKVAYQVNDSFLRRNTEKIWKNVRNDCIFTTFYVPVLFFSMDTRKSVYSASKPLYWLSFTDCPIQYSSEFCASFELMVDAFNRYFSTIPVFWSTIIIRCIDWLASPRSF